MFGQDANLWQMSSGYYSPLHSALSANFHPTYQHHDNQQNSTELMFSSQAFHRTERSLATDNAPAFLNTGDQNIFIEARNYPDTTNKTVHGLTIVHVKERGLKIYTAVTQQYRHHQNQTELVAGAEPITGKQGLYPECKATRSACDGAETDILNYC